MGMKSSNCRQSGRVVGQGGLRGVSMRGRLMRERGGDRTGQLLTCQKPGLGGLRCPDGTQEAWRATGAEELRVGSCRVTRRGAGSGSLLQGVLGEGQALRIGDLIEPVGQLRAGVLLSPFEGRSV